MALNTQSIRFKDASTLTIASGVVTATQGYHIIASEAGTADDLDTITADFSDATVNSVNYRPMLLIKADTGDTITIKHGTGNIQLSNTTDYALSGDLVLQLFYDGTNWVNVDIISASSGEANTASNVGTAGVGIFKQKTGVDLEFKKLNAGSTKITITDDVANDEVDVDVSEANLTLDNIGGTLSVSKGGTGSTTASGARTNLDTEQTISGRALTSVTVATDDKVLIQDTSDSNNLKTVTAQSIADLGIGTIGSSTDNAVVRWDGTGGDTLQNSSVTVDDNGGISAQSRVTIADSATTPPLNITERASTPSTPSSNDIYLDDGTNTASGSPQFRRYTGATWEDIGGGSGGGAPEIAIFRHQETSGTDGGTFTSGSLQTLPLNTTVQAQSWASLSTNQLTLDAGDYVLVGYHVGASVQSFFVGLYDVTGTSLLTHGATTQTGVVNSVGENTEVWFMASVSIASGTNTYEIQGSCAATRAFDGMGSANSLTGGLYEVYGELQVIKTG